MSEATCEKSFEIYVVWNTGVPASHCVWGVRKMIYVVWKNGVLASHCVWGVRKVMCARLVYQRLLVHEVCERWRVKFRWTGVSLCMRCVKGDICCVKYRWTGVSLCMKGDICWVKYRCTGISLCVRCVKGVKNWCTSVSLCMRCVKGGMLCEKNVYQCLLGCEVCKMWYMLCEIQVYRCLLVRELYERWLLLDVCSRGSMYGFPWVHSCHLEFFPSWKRKIHLMLGEELKARIIRPNSGRMQLSHYQLPSSRLCWILPQMVQIILCKTSPDPV